MIVTKVAQADVADKIDTSYIMEQFPQIDRVGIIFVCTRVEREDDDWVDEDGRHIVICLPYDEVKRTDDIRPMMLEKAMERLRAAA